MTQNNHLFVVFSHSIEFNPCNVVFNRVRVKSIMTHNHTNDVFA